MFRELLFDIRLKLDRSPDSADSEIAFDLAYEAMRGIIFNSITESVRQRMSQEGRHGAWIEIVPDNSSAQGKGGWLKSDPHQILTLGLTYDEKTMRADERQGVFSVIQDALRRHQELIFKPIRTQTGLETSIEDVLLRPGENEHGAVRESRWHPLPIVVKFNASANDRAERKQSRGCFMHAMRDISGGYAKPLLTLGFETGKPEDLGETGARCANEGRSPDNFEGIKYFSAFPQIPSLFLLPVRRLDGNQIDKDTLGTAWQTLRMTLLRDDFRQILLRRMTHLSNEAGLPQPIDYAIADLPASSAAWKRLKAERQGVPLQTGASQEDRAGARQILRSFSSAWEELLPATRKKDDPGIVQAGNAFRKLKALQRDGGFEHMSDSEMKATLILHARLARHAGPDIATILPGKDRFLSGLADKADRAAAILPGTIMHDRKPYQR